jgi:hypothetical protein
MAKISASRDVKTVLQTEQQTNRQRDGIVQSVDQICGFSFLIQHVSRYGILKSQAMCRLQSEGAFLAGPRHGIPGCFFLLRCAGNGKPHGTLRAANAARGNQMCLNAGEDCQGFYFRYDFARNGKHPVSMSSRFIQARCDLI